MGSKYYAVYNGKEGSKIYNNWDEAKVNVNGIKGVKYKGFSTINEANEFLQSSGDYTLFKQNIESSPKAVIKEVTKLETSKDFNDDKYHVYVDGSFREGYKCYGFGAAVIKNGQVIKELSGAFSDERFISMRNVAGEVTASMEVIKWAIKEGIKEINIYYDYTGIAHWAMGTWKRNNELTIGYHEYFKSVRNEIKVNFIKVKGHSGDYYNDLVDKLAKDAVLKYK